VGAVRRTAPWVLLGAATAVVGWSLGALGFPSPYLFGALLVGLAVALVRPDRFDLPGWSVNAAQAVTGVTLGAYLQSSSLRALGHDWVPVALVSAATLALTLAAGVGLARATGVDRPTAALGMVAGGASGIVSMADELGADDRLVAFMQYLRVLVVVLLTPLLVAVAFPGDHAGAAAGRSRPRRWASPWAGGSACRPPGCSGRCCCRGRSPWPGWASRSRHSCARPPSC
jgi:membrane AbrB-like protein